jgi:hypothetical protein
MISEIIPGTPSQEYLVQLVRAQYQIWREEKEAREPKFIIENIQFKHDPQWRERFWSLEAARECKRWEWQAVRILYLGAATAPYLLKLF